MFKGSTSSRMEGFGLWFMAHGLWLVVHGSWVMVHGSWFMASYVNA